MTPDPAGRSDLAVPPETVTRIVYLGTPEVGVPPLLALHSAGFEIPLVVSGADKRRGRGSSLVASPVKQAAIDLGIPVTDDVDAVLEVGADLGVVVAFGRLIRPHILERLAMVNLHFSLLPRWRGAAPVERALLAGDAETGVCVMQVAEGLDTGDIYRTVRLPIGPDATLASLRAELVAAGAALLVEALGQGLGPGEPQVGEPVYAAKLETSDYRLDFERSALDLDRVIRLGGAWCTFRGRRLKIWRATLGESSDLQPGEVRRTEVGTATSSLELVEVQPEGRPRMAARDWANGAQPRADERLV